MLIAVPALHVPGRCTTVAILLGGLTIAAIVWCGLAPAHRPPLFGLLAAAPVGFLVLMPFLAAGRAGILGVSVNNDMSAHMLWVDAYISPAVAAVTSLPTDYPLGPHAMVALITNGFGIQVDQAFAGWTMALPLLNAWTALAVAPRASWLVKVAVATVVGMPFLVAAYYGQGAFKEVLQAGLVLAVALLLAGFGPTLRRGRWVPFALLIGGIVSVYSIAGLPWPFVFVGLWLAGIVAMSIRRHDLKGLVSAARRQLPPLGIGCAILVIALLPQVHRLIQFISLRSGTNGTGISTEDIGNLIGAVPGWEALGVWSTPDFRLPASGALTANVWMALIGVLVVVGAAWAIRRGRWLLPLAAAGGILIWALSTASQSPYVAAKGLVVASPLVLLLAVLPLTDSKADRPRWWMIAVPVVGLILAVSVGVSDVRALRISPIGPTNHARELSSLRSALAGQPTLFLGEDDYVAWELAGVPVESPESGGGEPLPMRPQKAWAYGKALDFDSVDAATLNEYDWVITTRDAAGSAPPPQLHLVRTTSNYALWHRVGQVQERSLLAEGDMAGRVLECRTPRGRAIVKAGGVAAVRAKPVVVPAPAIGPGGTVSGQLQLPPGTWDLEAPYTSPLPVQVRWWLNHYVGLRDQTVGGFHATLPANLDRPGPRWPIGRITVRHRRPLTITFHVEGTALTPATSVAVINAVVATRVAPERIVPIARACGGYVDWYRSASG